MFNKIDIKFVVSESQNIPRILIEGNTDFLVSSSGYQINVQASEVSIDILCFNFSS